MRRLREDGLEKVRKGRTSIAGGRASDAATAASISVKSAAGLLKSGDRAPISVAMEIDFAELLMEVVERAPRTFTSPSARADGARARPAERRSTTTRR